MVKLPEGITTISGQSSHSLNMSFGLSKDSSAFDNGSDEDDDKAVSAETVRGSVTQPPSDDVLEDEAESRLVPGDRIIVKYLDDPKARPECYVMTCGTSDKVNGLLSLASPLALALSDASPGDEVTIQLGDLKRPILYLSLERDAPTGA